MKLTALIRRRPPAYIAPAGETVVPAGLPPLPEPLPPPLLQVVPAPAPVDDRPSWDPSGRFLRAPRPKLTIASHRLIIELHETGEPVAGLARRFPHVMNTISEAMPRAQDVVDAIDELLADRRGGRRGFPADVLAELLAVRTRYAARTLSLADPT